MCILTCNLINVLQGTFHKRKWILPTRIHLHTLLVETQNVTLCLIWQRLCVLTEKKISGRSLLIVNPHINKRDKPKREDQSHGFWNKSSLNFHLSESKMIWWTGTDRRAMHGNMKYFHYNNNDVFGLCCQTKVCLMKGCNSCPHLKHRLPYKLLILAGREKNFIVNSLTHWIARQNKTLKRSKRRTDRNNSLESIPKDMKWVTLKCQKE